MTLLFKYFACVEYVFSKTTFRASRDLNIKTVIPDMPRHPLFQRYTLFPEKLDERQKRLLEDLVSPVMTYLGNAYVPMVRYYSVEFLDYLDVVQGEVNPRDVELRPPSELGIVENRNYSPLSDFAQYRLLWRMGLVKCEREGRCFKISITRKGLSEIGMGHYKEWSHEKLQEEMRKFFSEA